MPDFTTRAKVLVAMNEATGGEDEANIDAMLSQCTAAMLKILGRPYWDTTTEDAVYPEFRDKTDIFFTDYPIVSIGDIWISTDRPRVYDSTTVLVAGEDYLHDAPNGIIHRLGGTWPTQFQSVKATVRTGTADGSQSADLIRAADIILVNWLQKGKSRSFHLTGSRLGDGAVAGIRFDDIPHTARELIENYAEKRVR